MQTNHKNTYELPESLATNLGIHILFNEDGTVKASMPVDSRTSRPCEPEDILNGGASLALAETVAGYGSLAICSSQENPVGIQVSANHIGKQQWDIRSTLQVLWFTAAARNTFGM